MSKEKLKVLFLCTGNSCRSQMAEGLVNHYLDPDVQAFSAGTMPGRVHSKAIQVMGEIGIDLSHHDSKHLRDIQGESFDYVITLCDAVRETCPAFPGTVEQYHLSFMDPAQVKGSDEEVLQIFRKVRDEIKEKVLAWLIKKASGPKEGL